MSSSLALSTKLKVSQIYCQSFARLIDKKSIFFMGHKSGIHTYDITNNKIEQLKLDKQQYSGPFSCFTISDELVFFCCGSKILAMAQNLKIIFQFDTFLALDKIDGLHIHGYRVFVISENMINEFLIGGNQLSNKKSRLTPSSVQKSSDVNEQVFDAKINHSLMINISTEKPFLLILKASNQICTFEKKDTEATLKTNSPPTYAFRYPEEPSNENLILVGTASGQILYIEVNRKSIKKLWSISQNKGKVNSICEIKNGFFVARDKVIQFWTKNKQIIKQQALQQKVVCSYYIPNEQLLIYGTLNGSIVQIKNYEKIIKQNKKIDQVKQRAEVQKEIELLKYKKNMLQQKLMQKRNSKKVPNSISTKKINLKTSCGIDYVNLCYNVEIQSDEKICKIICSGPISLQQDNANIFFEGKIENGRENVYIMRYENQTNIQIKVKYPEVFNQLDKLQILVYFSFHARVHDVQIDLKQLSLHQKISAKSFDLKNPYLNRLEVGGSFKQFQIKMWLGNIFNDFISQTTQGFQIACYQSIITKDQIYICFKQGSCSFYAQSANPLMIIKKKILQKSRQKNVNISFDTSTSLDSVKQFIANIQPRMRQFIEIKKKNQLIPGLLELKNELSLEDNSEMLKILEDRDQITTQYKQNIRIQIEIKQKIMDLYKSYKYLNNKQTNQFEQKSILTALDKWDSKILVKTIIG